ncbi:MAG: Maf family nucleotide pyrophosphatase, partial [Demequinaceae bacterium]|nr:Maf family nucleotide pyrophosphatase [Demequinaceae bacterium]
MPVPLVLASASPARLSTLRSAGIEPTVIVADIDEDGLLANARDLFSEHRSAGLGPELVLRDQPFIVASAKAEWVQEHNNPDALILGCDSMLEFRGELLGKPGSPEVARDLWHKVREQSAILHTAHALIDNRIDSRDAQAGEVRVGDTSSTIVRFADLTDAEIDAYVATGEPLGVAGGFTIDGLGGPFIEGIDGDHHGVIGLSLPLLRRLLIRLGLSITDLW